MKVNGLVYKIKDMVYLSLICPNKNKPTDGLPITEGVYESMTHNEISFCEVIITDGTMDLDMDVFDFVENYFTNHEPGDIFFNIKDFNSFIFSDNTIEEICDSGEFDIVVDDIIQQMEEEKKQEN